MYIKTILHQKNHITHLLVCVYRVNPENTIHLLWPKMPRNFVNRKKLKVEIHIPTITYVIIKGHLNCSRINNQFNMQRERVV